MPNYSGIWTEQAMMQAVAAGTWAGVPGAPTIGTATSLSGTSVSVAFTAPAFAGLPAVITGYTVTSSPGGITATGATSPITVTGLTEGTPYTFTVTATNASGTSSPSAASNSVTPVQIDYIEDVFSTYLYTGAYTAPVYTQTINNGIDLSGEGGLVWLKDRGATGSHRLCDTARGALSTLFSDSTSAAVSRTSPSSDVDSFSATGFVAGNFMNQNGNTYASWTFRKQPKFFDVVTYTGAGSVDYAHALGSVPGFALYKATNGTSNWNCVCRKSDGTYELLQLNTTASTFATYANAAAAGLTSTTFNPSPAGSATPSTQFVAYLFAHNAGGFGLSGTDNVISCGSYTGNGSSTGPVVDLGYEPQWVMVKQSSASGQWWNMIDVMRGFDVSTGAQTLGANASDVEYTNAGFGSGTPIMSPTATGFQVRSAQPATNASGATYIYIAIRRGPMKVPTTGASVFEPLTYTGNNTTTTGQDINTTFPMDFAFTRYNRSGAGDWDAISRLQGLSTAPSSSPYLNPHTTSAEATGGYLWQVAQLQLKIYGFSSSTTQLNYLYRRAPGFFDVVCYTGTGSATTFTHNLGVVPELMIVKTRSGTNNWMVYSQPVGNTAALYLNANFDPGTNTWWNNTTPTASVFSLGTTAATNASGATFVAYLFASCPGVSKVGSYTGTGALQTIDCGFAAGSRFVLIKRTDSTGDWYTYDSARGLSSSSDPYLFLNSTAAEVTGTNYVDTTSVGFQVTAAAPAGLNASGGTYIFLAIA